MYLLANPPAATSPLLAALKADWNRGSLKSDSEGTVMPYGLVGPVCAGCGLLDVGEALCVSLPALARGDGAATKTAYLGCA